MPGQFPFSVEPWCLNLSRRQNPPEFSDLYRRNHLNVLEGICKEMQLWQSLNILWFGRATLIKMLLISHIFHILQTSPIRVPPTFFYLYKKECTPFIWGKKPPRIKYARLKAPKHKGGPGFPDLQGYYTACLLARIVDWKVHKSIKAVVALEGSRNSLPLHLLPWP